MKNTLIQYQGGGYDGCFWEWNFAYIDKQSVYHTLFHSGYDGCSDRKTFINKFRKAYHRKYNKCFMYCLDNPEEIEEFFTESNDDNILLVAKCLAKIGVKLPVRCEECEQVTSPDYLFHTGYKGCGGIEVLMTGLMCGDCLSGHLCPYCGECHVDTRNIKRDHCVYCEEIAREPG